MGEIAALALKFFGLTTLPAAAISPVERDEIVALALKYGAEARAFHASLHNQWVGNADGSHGLFQVFDC